MKRVIGLTGQSGSGKSTVSGILISRNIPVIDCDALAHKNMEIGGAAYDEIVSAFGDRILNSDKTINRKILGNIVFNDKKSLELLNKIAHSHIKKQVIEFIEKNDISVIDAPVLFEAGLDSLCTEIWSVVAPFEIRLERIIKRDNISREKALERFKNQKSNEFFIENSDVIIENTGNYSYLKERIDYEINKILN